MQFEGVVPPLMADGMTKDASRNGIFEIPIMIDRWEFEVGCAKTALCGRTS